MSRSFVGDDCLQNTSAPACVIREWRTNHTDEGTFRATTTDWRITVNIVMKTLPLIDGCIYIIRYILIRRINL